MALKTVKAWAVVMKDDGFLPDFYSGGLGSTYHVCSDKKSADDFVKDMGDALWEVRPATITY